jgi:hypothetical protein
MRITDAQDRSIVPLHDFIHQTHQTGVGDQRANFRFADSHIVTAMICSAVASLSFRAKSSNPGA